MERAPAHAVPGRAARRPLARATSSTPLAGGRARARARRASRTRARRTGTASSPRYHWLDDLGNPIDWDGLRAPLPALAPGRARRPPSSTIRAARSRRAAYRLAFDLVLEHRYWLSEIGNEMLEVRSRGARARCVGRGRAPPAGGRAGGRLARPRPRGPRGGLHGRRRRDREPPAASSAPYRPAAGATRRFRSRSSARRCCRRSSRTARSRASRPGGPKAGSRGSTTGGSSPPG